MASLSMTSRRQVTFRKDAVEHLGLEPGQKIDMEKMPDGSLRLTAAKRTGTIDDFIGFLKGKSKKKLTIQQMNQVIADGWAGKH